MKKFFPIILVAIILYVPLVADAQRYLVELPDLKNKDSFDEYINLLYKISISLAALLAVVKIMIAGAKYMLTDIVTSKSEAKSDIKGALLGLLLIIGAVIILETINPKLTDGGLSIARLTVPKVNLSAPAVKTADGKTVDEKAAELAAAAGDACAKPAGTVLAPSGTRNTARTDISTCQNKDQVIANIKAACEKTAGSEFAVGPDKAWVGCATPIKSEITVDGKTITLTGKVWGAKEIPPETNLSGGVNMRYLSRDGSYVVLDIKTNCQEDPEWDTVSYMTYDECIQEETEDFRDYCIDYAAKGIATGGITSLTHKDGKLACQLPSRTLNYYETEKLYNQVSDGLTPYSNEVYKSFCTSTLKGTYADIQEWSEGDVAGDDGDEFRCVWY